MIVIELPEGAQLALTQLVKQLPNDIKDHRFEHNIYLNIFATTFCNA